MGRVEKSIEIRALPEKVWELLELDRLPEWNEEYGNVKYTSEVRNPKTSTGLEHLLTRI